MCQDSDRGRSSDRSTQGKMLQNSSRFGRPHKLRSKESLAVRELRGAKM